MAMERIEGETLRTWATSEPSLERRIEAVLDLSEGLNAVHRVGLLHRDVKPANVMVDRDGRVRLMDFGLARQRVEDERSAQRTPGSAERISSPAGTPGFIAPEVLDGARPTERSDQFSFAVTALAILEDAPARVLAVLERARATDPRSRWPRMDTLIRALERAARVRRRRGWMVPAAAVVAVLGGGAVLVSSAEDAPAPCLRRERAKMAVDAKLFPDRS